MSAAPSLTGLDEVRALVAAEDPEGRLTPCELGELVVGPATISQLPGLVGRVAPQDLPGPAQVVLLVDQTPIRRAGADLKALVELDLATRFALRRVVLSDGHPELHVTPAVVADAVSGCTGAHVVVALGGGTISDIGKLVAAEVPGVRLVTVMTAASVDGYTDDVSVMLRDGVKRTVPSVWPDAVLADAETVAAAPARMNRAGYGEMTSMYVAPADWRLAALVGVDPSFHRGPVALLDALRDRLDACAPGVATGDPVAVQELTWALALRGIATGVAGSTACLSGVEHLISHMLDLRAAELHLPTGLHGEQVGAGSVVAACAWEMLHERLAHDPQVAVDARALDRDTARARVGRAFGTLDPSGRIADECWRDYERKLDRVSAALPTLQRTVSDWQEHAVELRSLVRPSDDVARGLRAAAAPSRLADLRELGDDVDGATARWAVANCALMRDRFTVVDLLTLLGWWQDEDVEEIEHRVAAALGLAEVAA